MNLYIVMYIGHDDKCADINRIFSCIENLVLYFINNQILIFILVTFKKETYMYNLPEMII